MQKKTNAKDDFRCRMKKSISPSHTLVISYQLLNARNLQRALRTKFVYIHLKSVARNSAIYVCIFSASTLSPPLKKTHPLDLHLPFTSLYSTWVAEMRCEIFSPGLSSSTSSFSSSVQHRSIQEGPRELETSGGCIIKCATLALDTLWFYGYFVNEITWHDWKRSNVFLLRWRCFPYITTR